MRVHWARSSMEYRELVQVAAGVEARWVQLDQQVVAVAAAGTVDQLGAPGHRSAGDD